MLDRETDVGLVLALLVAVANGDTFERADAAHALLKWRNRDSRVSKSCVTLYIEALKVIYPFDDSVME